MSWTHWWPTISFMRLTCVGVCRLENIGMLPRQFLEQFFFLFSRQTGLLLDVLVQVQNFFLSEILFLLVVFGLRYQRAISRV